MARRLGAYTSTVNTWENHHFTPDVRFVPKIIEFLGYAPRPVVIEAALGAGFVVVVSAPAWGLGTVATIGVAALAGGGTGAVFGGVVEVAASEKDCNGKSDLDLLAGIAAGFKGGFFGGATVGVVLADNPAFTNAFEGTSVGQAAQAI